MKIPRSYQPLSFKILKTSIHVFSDASELGYGAAIYLRHESDEGEVSCSLAFGRSRVTPIKPVTIPRLELQAAVLFVRSTQQILKELRLGDVDIHFWTDFTIVLHYISNTKSRFQTFVANRIAYIKNNTSPNQWRHIRSTLNPADIASRGSRALPNDLKVWINGPEFLQKSENYWPNYEPEPIPDDHPEIEVRRNAHVLTAVQPQQTTDILLSHYSDWPKLIRSVAYYLRVKKFLLNKIRNSNQIGDISGHVQVDEIRKRNIL